MRSANTSFGTPLRAEIDVFEVRAKLALCWSRPAASSSYVPVEVTLSGTRSISLAYGRSDIAFV